ncbi:MAG: hypothetical protein P1V51_19220 [Deltaproteobacteria bacterium]|nr:hypothetical protein [Deltaproteobacteria bacterium]
MTTAPSRVGGLLLALLLLVPLGAAAAPAGQGSARYLDPPLRGLDHAGRTVLEVAPVFLYAMRSVLRGQAEDGPGIGLELRLARGLEGSGDEVGLRLRGSYLAAWPGVMLSGGYRTYFGRERWKTFLEIELALAYHGGPQAGLRAAGGMIYELGPDAGLVLELGALGTAGAAMFGWAEARAALQLRF